MGGLITGANNLVRPEDNDAVFYSVKSGGKLSLNFKIDSAEDFLNLFPVFARKFCKCLRFLYFFALIPVRFCDYTDLLREFVYLGE